MMADQIEIGIGDTVKCNNPKHVGPNPFLVQGGTSAYVWGPWSAFDQDDNNGCRRESVEFI